MNHRKSMFQVSGVHYIELKATVQTRHQLFCREDGKCHETSEPVSRDVACNKYGFVVQG